MAIKRRKLPGSELTETVGLAWRDAMQHELLVDFCKYEGYESTAENIERAFLASKGFRGVPAIDCSEHDHVYLHALSVILYYAHDQCLYGDKAYRRLDEFLFHNIGGRMIRLGPVARELYLSGLYHFRCEHPWRRARRYKNPSYWHAISLGKNTRDFWITTSSR